MAHRIPVAVSVTPGYPPLDDLALDLFQVTQDGAVAKAFGRFPVAGGAAEVPDVPLADPVLRWAIRISDVRLGGPVYRSGPLGRLPGAGRLPFADHVRLHRGGGHLGLDADDGAPQALVEYVRGHLPPGVAFTALDLGADAPGRYVLTFHGVASPLPFQHLPVVYRRGLGIAPAVDPGRARRVAVAWPQGPAENLGGGLVWPATLQALDVVLAAGVEAQMTAMATHVGWLMLLAAGITDLMPQTVSLTSIALAPDGGGVGADVILTAGALAGGLRVFDPSPPLTEA